MNKPEFLIIHHEAPPEVVIGDRFNVVNEYHKSQDFPISSLGFYCGYHYFIEKSGTLIQARKDYETGAHTKGWNEKSIGIGLAGNFDLEIPTTAQILTLQRLLNEKRISYQLTMDKIVPHRKFAQKTCYGKLLADDWAKNLIIDPKKVEETQQKQIGLLRLLIEKIMTLITILKRRI